MGERCKTCAHDSKPWYEEPCDSCCGAHSGYEPINLQPTCNQLATDCISRQAAIDEAKHYIEIGYDSDIIYTLENLPPAHQEIIRCGECIHKYDHDCPISWGKTDDDYCSYAERKEDGSD